jgi:hypothetical protein
MLVVCGEYIYLALVFSYVLIGGVLTPPYDFYGFCALLSFAVSSRVAFFE